MFTDEMQYTCHTQPPYNLSHDITCIQALNSHMRYIYMAVFKKTKIKQKQIMASKYIFYNTVKPCYKEVGYNKTLL